MSGLMACTGEFIPIPFQIVSLVILLINKGVPGITDAWTCIAEFIDSFIKSLMVFGK